MPAAKQVEVADRRPDGRREGVALIRGCLLQVGFHVHASDFTKKIKRAQAEVYLFGCLSER